MGIYNNFLVCIRKDLTAKVEADKKVIELTDRLISEMEEFQNMLDAQKLLTSVSEQNTDSTLNFITGVVNKTLSEIFKGDTRRIHLKKVLYNGQKPHIVVELEDGEGHILDMEVQSGTGLRQIVSVLYVICLIEIRKGRRLLILDERLSGLHKEAKRILSEIIKIFAERGFQFVFVEYALSYDVGTMYNVEKVGNIAEVHRIMGNEYDDNTVFMFSDVDTSEEDMLIIADED